MKIFCIVTLFKVRLTQDFDLLGDLFIQVSLYMRSLCHESLICKWSCTYYLYFSIVMFHDLVLIFIVSNNTDWTFC